MDDRQRMRQLIDRLNETAHAYYDLDDPLISDAEWDALYNELTALENASGIRLEDSPSHRVGGVPLQAFPRHRHLARLWSMDKVQSEGELTEWFARAERLIAGVDGLPPLMYGIEYKFDGLTINLTYQNGALAQAATRGNGEVGEAILPQARTIRSIPLSIPFMERLEVQGECIMRLSSLKKYNAVAKDPLKNARNAAAGALRNLDPAVTASRGLSAYFYQIGYIENAPYRGQREMLKFLEENGFPVSPYFKTARDSAAVLQAVREIEASRGTLDFLIDGAVIKVQDEKTRENMGYTDKFPRWAVAFKFMAEESTSVLEAVTWELGRTGKLTPLAHITPVDFAGVTVRRATLNNWGDILRKDLALGCTVWIRRSNDVIPEITGRVNDGTSGTPIEKPDCCPACGERLIQRGAHWYCLNRAGCKPQAVARLAHFASRDAMDIDTFSERTADLLYENCGVRDPADLYAVSEGMLLKLDGFKDKRAKNLISALEASRHCALGSFLYALGIPNVGQSTARDLAACFKTLAAVQTAAYETLIRMEEIGEIVAQSIVDFFSYPENQAMVRRLLDAGVSPQPVEDKPSGGALAGKTVVVTGTLPTLSRSEAEALIRENGGTASGSVSRKTSLLLCGENAGSKLDKARELGVPVMDEESFLQFIQTKIPG
jgi:DNA ligase (NAD+)